MNIIKQAYLTLNGMGSYPNGKLPVRDAESILRSSNFPHSMEMAKTLCRLTSNPKRLISTSVIDMNNDPSMFDSFELSNDQLLAALKTLSRAAKQDEIIHTTISELAQSAFSKDQIIVNAFDLMPDHFWYVLVEYKLGHLFDKTFIFNDFSSTTEGHLSFVLLDAILTTKAMDFNMKSIAVLFPEDLAKQSESELCEGCTKDHCVMDDEKHSDLSLQEQLHILMTEWRAEFDLLTAEFGTKHIIKFSKLKRIFKQVYGKRVWKSHFYGLMEILAKGSLGVVKEIDEELYFEFNASLNANSAREIWFNSNEDEDYDDEEDEDYWDDGEYEEDDERPVKRRKRSRDEDDEEDEEESEYREPGNRRRQNVSRHNKHNRRDEYDFEEISDRTNSKLNQLFRNFSIAAIETILNDIDGMTFANIIEYSKQVHEIDVSDCFKSDLTLEQIVTIIFEQRFKSF